MFTPASPLFGSTSYMSQDSSCCSVLNNAVIMDDDDNETIPTDERPILVPIGSVQIEDVSPIVEKSFNVSDLVPLQSSTIISSTTFPNPSGVSEDRNNSSLQEFLNHAPAPLDVAFIASSPGPHWSPGIKSSSLNGPNPPVIRIESTLNFLEGMPSASPKKKLSTTDSSSVSLSAIFPGEAAPPENRIEQREPSPVRRLTRQRSAGPLPLVPLPGDEKFQDFPSPSMSFAQKSAGFNQNYPRKMVLTSEERELRDAEEGRRRLLAQIRVNRRNFQTLNSDQNRSFSRNATLSSSRIRSTSLVPTSRGPVRVQLSTPTPPSTGSSFLGTGRSLRPDPSLNLSSRYVDRPSRLLAPPSCPPRMSTAAIYAARRAPSLRPAWR